MPAPSSSTLQRGSLRQKSLSWALLAGTSALALGLLLGLEQGLRAGGCGFFYGLLAFHLQRVDPDDDHLQAGLVGAVCGILSLGTPAPLWAGAADLIAHVSVTSVMAALPSLMMALIRAWLPLWLPIAGAALLLHGAQVLVPALRP